MSKKAKYYASLSCLLLSLLSQPSAAHLLKVFAYQQPASQEGMMQVSGKIYFSGASSLAQAPFEVFDQKNQRVLASKADAKGEFSFNIASDYYQIKANSLDGHVATWDLSPIHATQAADNGTRDPNTHLPAAKNSKKQLKEQETNAFLTEQQWQHLLESSVTSAVAEQVKPLTEQIVKLQEKARYSDILGAVGYIFGVFGLFSWWRFGRTTDTQK